MDSIGTHTTLRARILANGTSEARLGLGTTTVDEDPFAGEDALWAPEDWYQPSGADDSQRFFVGLIVGIALSALSWLLIASAVILAYRVIT